MKPDPEVERNIKQALAQWDELTRGVIVPLKLKDKTWYDRETRALDLASTGLTILGRKP